MSQTLYKLISQKSIHLEKVYKLYTANKLYGTNMYISITNHAIYHLCTKLNYKICTHYTPQTNYMNLKMELLYDAMHQYAFSTWFLNWS